MILPIEKYGSDKLRVKARKVAVTPELAALAESMLETMYKAKGVGLAAEQVGRDEAMCVIDVPLSCEDDEETKAFNSRTTQPLVMFNPEMATVRGFLARAVCHETDHLKGILYVDHMDEKAREKVLKKLLKKK